MNSLPLLKEDLERLYLSGQSMKEISKSLNCSIHKIVYWMDKFNIPRRSFSDAVYLQANPNGDPFKIKTLFIDKEQLLYGLGLGIYWGEGEKVSKGKVRVANSDANLIRTFRNFLITICQVTISRIHYSLICFNDSNPKKVRNFWSEVLEIPGEKFGKIVQIAPQGKGSYKRKSQYGVCIIEVSNIRLKAWIIQELKKIYFLP